MNDKSLLTAIFIIVYFYTRDSCKFSDNFTKTIFHANEEVVKCLKNEENNEHVTNQPTDQVTEHVQKIDSLNGSG